jgi:general secretion pathway protein G
MIASQSIRQRGFTLLEMLIVVAIIGLLASIGVPYMLGAIDSARQKKSVADISNIAKAVEIYQNDVTFYPIATSLSAIEALDPAAMGIQPKYLTKVPTKDGWQGFYYYESTPGTRSYMILSYGKDKKQSSSSSGVIHNFDCDIIFQNGAFISYPEGAQE